MTAEPMPQPPSTPQPPLPSVAPVPPPIHVAGWPAGEPSERPKPAEWDQAPEVALSRLHRDCRSARVREWLRVTCTFPASSDVMSVRVLGGSDEGVEISDAPKRKAENGAELEGVHVVLPVRPGDRRVLQLAQPEFTGFRSYTPEESLWIAISALWLKGAPGPTIVVD